MRKNMNNEPVAWMYERPNGNAKLTFVREPMAGTVVTETPLYTHPARESKAKDRFSNYESICLQCGTTIYKPAKTLTDEEIESWITEWAKDLYGTLYVEPTDHQRTMAIKMARAILKKASEK
jgi:hypothetical protein